MTQTDFNFGRLAEFDWLHAAVDCAEYAGTEDFVAGFVAVFNTRSILELWALGGMLHREGHCVLAEFVERYAAKAERSRAALGASFKPARDMPSPVCEWAEWLGARAYKSGYREGWKAALKPPREESPPPPAPTRPTLVYAREESVADLPDPADPAA